MLRARFFRYEYRSTRPDTARTFYANVVGPEIWSRGAVVTTLPEQALSKGARPHWLGHIGPADVASVVARMTQLGPTRPEGDAVVLDPFGARFAVARSGEVPEPSCVAWALHHSEDRDQAFALYSELFGWSEEEMLDRFTNLARLPEVHPQWLYFFRVPDLDAAMERTRALGGLVLQPVRAPSGNRVVPCNDAEGGAFGLFS